MYKGKLFIISSVAGGGKSTLIKKLLSNHPEILFSVSCTSRPRRPLEQEGKDYHFLSRKEFEEKIDSHYFFEWALVHDNYYGTPKAFIVKNLKEGKIIVLDIDVQGAEKVKESLPESLSIFILPPSQDIWIQRLKDRGTETPEVLEKRIRNGLKELLLKDHFDYQIINDDLDTAYEQLEKIIKYQKFSK
jgi:guanylate kinase